MRTKRQCTVVRWSPRSTATASTTCTPRCAPAGTRCARAAPSPTTRSWRSACSARTGRSLASTAALVAFVDRCPHRMAPLSAGSRVRRSAAVRLPRLPLRRRRPVRARSRRSATAPTCRRGRRRPAPAPSPSATGWCGWRPDPPVTDRSTCPSGTTRRSPSWPCPRSTWNAGAAQMIDNFLDLAHFPYLHPATFGDPDDHEVGAVLGRARRPRLRVDYLHSTTHIGDSPAAATTPSHRRARRHGVRRAVLDPPAHRLPRRRRRADDPVLPPAGRRHHDQAVLLRPPQRHRRRPHDASRTRAASRWPSPPRTGRCSSVWSTSRSRSTCRPRCTPGPTGSRSRCAASCSTWSPRSPPEPDGLVTHGRGEPARHGRRWLPPLLGSLLLLAVWIVGGRAGWARGMVVTPAEAVGPIVGDRSRDVYLRATEGHGRAAARGLLIGGVIGFAAALVASVIPALRRVVTPARRARQRRAVGRGRTVPADRPRPRAGDRWRWPPSPCSSRVRRRPTSGW